MNASSRVPALKDLSYLSISHWYESMAKADLLFHPDDAPEDIVKISNGAPTFSAEECVQLNGIISTLFDEHGSDVYDAAYPSFIKALTPQHIG